MPEGTIAPRRLSALTPAERQARLERGRGQVFTAARREYAARVLDDVARQGDAAVAAYTARWDGVALAPDRFAVTDDEVRAAHRALEDSVHEALRAAIARSRRYNLWLRPPALALAELEPGVTVGVQYTACRSAGIYVPSGKGSFPSMAVAMVTPAVVAGVEEIAVVVPPRPDGSADPAVVVAADLLGVRRIFRCNGAAGVAALAVGTAAIPRTDVVVGPGNPVIAAVQCAAAAYGARSPVLLGPSEAVVLADGTADADRLAVDLLNEAEHGADSAVMLVTVEEALARGVAARLPALLGRLPQPRRDFARAALVEQGGLFVADDLEQAIAWVNAYAPEHLMLAVRDPAALLPRIRHAGEILMGLHTPFAAANYAIGVPAALPTGGAAVAASGVTVWSFLKVTSLAQLDERGLRAVGPVAVRLGQYEGFPAHVQALTAREVHA
ncbi:MAG: histidinol dehydrogenase [Armatimonadota bacterium]|nr:histidinol dehydrogenase [Armatimonadota bacterium]MDR7532859.1 histidinol dehydrogenase [Armatimonadota bacterium]MDR7535137.1 histidinol dehydrogenase [Armatimonadota bacterium]